MIIKTSSTPNGFVHVVAVQGGTHYSLYVRPEEPPEGAVERLRAQNPSAAEGLLRAAVEAAQRRR